MKKHPVISLDEGGSYVKGNEAGEVCALTEETHVDVAEAYETNLPASQDAPDHTRRTSPHDREPQRDEVTFARD
jgi:hypothetical protein